MEKRKLTEAEQRRKVEFEKIQEQLKAKGYRPRNLTEGVVKANVLALVIMLPFVIVEYLIYAAYSDGSVLFVFTSLSQTLFFIVLTIVLTVGHELIHGITWGLASHQHGKDIEFGVIWSMLTPYCTCSSPLTKFQYILGGAMPTLVIGIVGTLVAIGMNSSWIFIATELMIIGGGGDFLIILKVLFDHPKPNALYYDHPYELGLVVFEK